MDDALEPPLRSRAAQIDLLALQLIPLLLICWRSVHNPDSTAMIEGLAYTPPCAVALSDDGRWLAESSEVSDGCRIRELPSGRRIAFIPDLEDELHFSPCGRWLLGERRAGRGAQVVETRRWQVVHTLPNDAVFAGWSADGSQLISQTLRWLAGSVPRHAVMLIDTSSWSETRHIEEPGDPVVFLGLGSDGRILLRIGDDGIWYDPADERRAPLALPASLAGWQPAKLKSGWLVGSREVGENRLADLRLVSPARDRVVDWPTVGVSRDCGPWLCDWGDRLLDTRALPLGPLPDGRLEAATRDGRLVVMQASTGIWPWDPVVYEAGNGGWRPIGRCVGESFWAGDRLRYGWLPVGWVVIWSCLLVAATPSTKKQEALAASSRTLVSSGLLLLACAAGQALWLASSLSYRIGAFHLAALLSAPSLGALALWQLRRGASLVCVAVVLWIQWVSLTQLAPVWRWELAEVWRLLG